MRLICFPSGWHSYQILFSQAMSKHEIYVEAGREFSNQHLLESVASVDGINFQWAENLWSAASVQRRVRSIIGVRKYCRLVKRLGKLVVWTVHNHERHEGTRLGDLLGYRTIANAADLIIVHSRWSEAFVRSKFRPKGKIVVMPHGNFRGLYTPKRDTAEVRKACGLELDVPVCGLVGGIRPYRGHEIAIDAVRRMKGKVQLLIAGSAMDDTYHNKIRSLIANCPHIAVCDRRLNDTEYAEMVQACDVTLLPYHNITGSGALLASWTLGRPVVTSDLPFFKEFQPDDNAAGVMMRNTSSECLAACVQQLLSYPEEARVGAAWHEAEKYSWDKVVLPVVAEINEWVKRQNRCLPPDMEAHPFLAIR